MRRIYIPRAQSKPAVNTIDIATSKASKLPDETLERISLALERSVSQLATAELSIRAWADLKMAVLVSRRIERMGVVKGLNLVWVVASEALDAVLARNMSTGTWNHTDILDAETNALSEMAKMHIFQLSHLSRAEFEKAVAAAQREVASHPKPRESLF